MLRHAVLLCSVIAGSFGCASGARHHHVSLLPRQETAGNYPAAEELDVVKIDAAEWKSIAKSSRASPCDRHAKFVATDGLALVNEAFRALAADGAKKVEAECTRETVRLDVGGRELDLDFLRAAVESDAHGKLVRLLGFSARSGRLVRAVYHLQKKRPTDGIVVVNVLRYLPTEIGPVYFHRIEDREELFVTSKGDDEKRGTFIVSRAWGEDDELQLGVGRYTVSGN